MSVFTGLRGNKLRCFEFYRTAIIVNVSSDDMMYFAEIYNLQGTKLEAKEINAYQTSLTFAKYPDGIYLMKINTDKGFITKRIIKQ